MTPEKKSFLKFRDEDGRVCRGEVDSDWGRLRTCSLYERSIALKEATCLRIEDGPSMYPLFTFESLYSPYLGISKLQE